MSNENTSLKNVTQSGDSNTTDSTVIGKSKIYQRPLLIVAGSLLVLLVWVAGVGQSGGQHLTSSVHEIAKVAVTLVDYEEDSTNLALTKDIFGLNSVSENDEGRFCLPMINCGSCKTGGYDNGFRCTSCGGQCYCCRDGCGFKFKYSTGYKNCL